MENSTVSFARNAVFWLAGLSYENTDCIFIIIIPAFVRPTAEYKSLLSIGVLESLYAGPVRNGYFTRAIELLHRLQVSLRCLARGKFHM